MAASSEAPPAPGGPAAPDDQGNLGICSRFVLGKAIANGFFVLKFDPNQKLDFDQSNISTAIVNTDEVKSKKKIFSIS